MKKAITAIIPAMAAVAAHAAQLVVGLADVCPAEGSSVPPACVNAFKAQGAEPRLLSWTNDLSVIDKMVEGIDLLMLCGGEDVEPARYKAQPSPKLGAVNKRRDAFEWESHPELGKLWEIMRDREAGRAIVHGVPKSHTRLSD